MDLKGLLLKGSFLKDKYFFLKIEKENFVFFIFIYTSMYIFFVFINKRKRNEAKGGQAYVGKPRFGSNCDNRPRQRRQKCLLAFLSECSQIRKRTEIPL